MEPREELADLTRMVRAYVEWQVDCGAHGTPRAPKAQRAAPALAAPVEPSEPIEETPPPPSLERPVEPKAAPAVVAAPQAPPPPLTREARDHELHVIREKVAECTQCGLAATRKNTVFARGNPGAELCFVGEGPGADEDAKGIPFVGRAGQLLDRMIAAMGLDTERDVYVCNIVKCRPPGNRRPEPDEIAACLPYVHAQIALVKPKCIVALGNTAVAALLGTKTGITRLRGSWKLYKGTIPVMPTYHPSHLLREEPTQAQHKKEAWEDLQKVMKQLGLSPPPRF